MTDATELQVTLVLPPTVAAVRAVRAVADAALGSLGVAESCRHDLLLALGEACTNVVRHAAATCYQVTITVAGGTCTTEVTDDGRGFSPHLPRVSPPVDTDAGRGLWLIAQTSHGLDIATPAGGGTRLRFTTDLRYARSGEISETVRDGRIRRGSGAGPLRSDA